MTQNTGRAYDRGNPILIKQPNNQLVKQYIQIWVSGVAHDGRKRFAQLLVDLFPRNNSVATGVVLPKIFILNII